MKNQVKNKLCCSMTRKQRLRRVALLCCHFLRNLAYYQAGWHEKALVYDDEFWKTANGNFLDICVLEWCKLFGDVHEKQYWGKVIIDTPQFFEGLLDEIGLSQGELETYVEEMREYRDKFVAHLDSDLVMDIPKLSFAQKSASYLYDYLLANEDEGDFFHGLPDRASSYYAQSLKEGKLVYKA